MAKFAHNDHLEQGEGGARGVKAHGSHTNPAGPTGAFTKKSSGSHLEQGEGGARSTRPTGSHTEPHPALTDQTAVRGGGGVRGHDRTNPTAGKSKSGSKFAQHPNNTKTKR